MSKNDDMILNPEIGEVYKTPLLFVGLPEYIKIGHLDVKISVKEDHLMKEGEMSGQWVEDKQEILLIETLKDWPLKEVFLHELLHAIATVWNIKFKKEEDSVCSLAIGLTTVFRDNPEILKFLGEINE